MKLNLTALREAGWHIGHNGDVLGEIELCPPPMSARDYQELRAVISSNLDGDAIAIDLVLQQTLIAMQKAALLAVIQAE